MGANFKQNKPKNKKTSTKKLQSEDEDCPKNGTSEQIMISANPPSDNKYGGFFSSQWCPLFGKLSLIKIPRNVLITRSRKIARCIDFIKEARKIWKCPSVEFETNWPKSEEITNYPSQKIIAARAFWNVAMLEHNLVWGAKVSVLKKAKNRLKILSKINDDITDAEIYAFIVIISAWYTLRFLLIQELKEDHLYITGALQASLSALEMAINDNKESLQIQSKIKVQKSSKHVLFPIPYGVTPNEIDITFIDNDHVKIKVRETAETVHYAQIGFKHKNGNKRIKLWDTLRIFAARDGTVTFQKFIIKKGKETSSTSEKLVTQDDVKRLNKILCNCFGFNKKEKLIYYDKKNTAYKTQFKISDATEDTRNYKTRLDYNIEEHGNSFFDISEDN
ncbi:MAG: hypothetical protein E3K37_03265 [Candidatus Kuenenia sp.]|nr:hypothetical protein [Candidatus Kuenenia hertensis]